MDPLAIKFEEEIRAKMLHAKKECRYNPTRFNQMLAKYGGVETAKRLIANALQISKTHELQRDLVRLIFRQNFFRRQPRRLIGAQVLSIPPVVLNKPLHHEPLRHRPRRDLLLQLFQRLARNHHSTS